MSNIFEIKNIHLALQKKLYPTIVMWNRLEGRPRTNNFDRALKAEVRDALWMLTKQWQMGEFQGDDAGSPVSVKLYTHHSSLFKFKPGHSDTESFNKEIPLEAQVERQPFPLFREGEIISLDIRLALGRHWLKLIKSVGNFEALYIKQYPVKLNVSPGKKDAGIFAHKEVWQTFAAVADRCMDGVEFYLHLKKESDNQAWKDINVPQDKKDDLEVKAEKFVKWVENLFFQPQEEGNHAWNPSALEYQFQCSAPVPGGEKVLTADEYFHGHLDWYNLDIDKSKKKLEIPSGSQPEEEIEKPVASFIPTPIQFEGMPNTRWWAFEDNKTNFGDIKPATNELAKLLLLEFGLVYANDWFMIPLTLPSGTVSNIKGMTVTNVFGERFWIEASGSGKDKNWERWNMFTLSYKDDLKEKADKSMLLLPTVPKIQEGRPLEEISIIRDEMANMVWGVENMVPLATGTSKRGAEAAVETLEYYKKLLAEKIKTGSIVPEERDYKAAIRYQVMSSVPENWIPFIPVHISGQQREIQLQRAAMPRILEGDLAKPERVRPQTPLMREGLEKSPQESYFVNEEEVPRAGVKLSRSYQRTRWYNGKVWVWLGTRKQVGRGEGTSGLAFDQIVNVDQRKLK